jgi:hypothetical protein
MFNKVQRLKTTCLLLIQNDDFWETPIGLKMMNDMMEKHEAYNQQKVFEEKQKNI